ncbi:glycosyltransferase family 2 protein [Xylanimonas protaetiae]|uniref:glycosyltransferase family 2 protein n=1 Tax=Xylanimonas protaetiae TaxID=2509457 RepID=UPI001F5DB560|nr:glycosyltransferase family 2 protein [Xylanimonas protaetiae]
MSDLPAHPPVVRVVCVVYNPGDDLRVFASTLATATRHPVELVIVDNGGPTDVVSALAREGAVVLRHPDGNVGYGRAANLGAAGSTADWLVVANPDVEWEPGSLDELLATGEADPGAGSLGPRILNTDGSTYPSARALPSLTVGAGHALLHTVWPGNPWTREYKQAEEAVAATSPRACGWLSGACLVVRPAAWAQVGGFDERYFMFFEDVDLGDRLGKAGWHNVYVPAARVTHVQGVSWKSSPAPMIRAHHASAKQYLFDRWGRGGRRRCGSRSGWGCGRGSGWRSRCRSASGDVPLRPLRRPLLSCRAVGHNEAPCAESSLPAAPAPGCTRSPWA